MSQASSELDVTLVRRTGGALARTLAPLTVNFSALPGSLPLGSGATADTTGGQFTAVSEPVTFPQGVTSVTVAVPINAGAPNPGLAPIQLSVTAVSGRVQSKDSTVFLASTADAVPPSIIGVQRVRGGIAVTFSKPMDPASVKGIHNYVVKYSPSQKYNPLYMSSVGLIQSLTATPQNIPLRRASYDSATNTVTLVPNQQLQSAGSFQIKSPASLLAKADRPNKARPLTDLQGNALDQGGTADGTFAITITKGHPYSVAPPVLAE